MGRPGRALLVLAVLAACDAPGTDRSAPPPRRSAAGAPRPARPTEPPAGAEGGRGFGRVEEGRLTTPALGVDKRIWVALPAEYDGSGLRYPVVYLLHGFGGSPENWTRAAPEAARVARLRALLVMVDGDDSFYVNWARPADYARCLREPRRWGPVDPEDYCVREGRYEDYVVHDVVRWIDARYRTIPTRQGRALAGFSMGGYGALMLAMRHPDVFGTAISHAGVDSLLYGGPRPWAPGGVRRLEDLSTFGREYEGEIEGIGDHVRGLLGDDLANWRAHDPVTLASSLRDGQLALYLDCGTEDTFHFDDLAHDLHDTLEQHGIAHAFALVHGRHDGAFLKARLDDGLRFAAEHLAAP